MANPPLGCPPGHHYHQVREKIKARVSVQVCIYTFINMAKNRHRYEVQFHFSENLINVFEFEGVSSQRPAAVQRSTPSLPLQVESNGSKFENTECRKVKQMQAMQLCILKSRQFEEAFENTQWREVKQMQPV